MPLASAIAAALAITSCGDHYVVKGHVVDDIDVLEKVVIALQARSVRLDSAAGTPEGAQRAAAHRFRALGLELRQVEPAEAACRILSIPSAAGASRPFGIDADAVDEWWHASMP